MKTGCACSHDPRTWPCCCPCHAHTQVVQEYTRLKPGNPLARYIRAMKAVKGKGDVFTGLDGFDDVVHSLANDKCEVGWSMPAGFLPPARPTPRLPPACLPAARPPARLHALAE